MGLLQGLAIGAGAMYFLDPVRGKRRRALVRDQCVSAAGRASCFFDKAVRDARHRIEGTLAEARHAFDEEQVSDEVLTSRVRSKLGRYASHPKAIEVSAEGGRVILSGTALEQEVPGLLRAISKVRGVSEVENRLTTHAEPGNVSDLQGGRHRSGDLPDILQENWAPATKLAIGGLSAMFLAKGLLRRELSTLMLGGLGLGLLASECQCQERQEEEQGASREDMQRSQQTQQQEPAMAPVEMGGL